LGSEWGTGRFRERKTGLFGDVWIEDRNLEQATPNIGENEPESMI